MKKRILFLCIGNSCRSQMAEGFARRYGSDILEAHSAGLAPAQIVQPQTKQVMAEKNIDIDDQWPKDLSSFSMQDLDLVVNMSGRELATGMPVAVRTWKVEDPIGCSEEIYNTVRDQIERLVMQLILELRREAKRAAPLAKPMPRAKQASAAKPTPPAKPQQAAPRRFFGRVSPRD